MARLTVARLREVLDYNPRTGIFRWRVSMKGTLKGAIAGWAARNGRREICIDYTHYSAARLAFLYMTKRLPKVLFDIDHANGNPGDDRWTNLRLATRAQNAANSRKQIRKCSTEFKGVCIDKSRPNYPYLAKIKVNQRTINLGRFRTAKQAHITYMKAARKHFGKFAHAG